MRFLEEDVSSDFIWNHKDHTFILLIGRYVRHNKDERSVHDLLKSQHAAVKNKMYLTMVLKK